MNSDPQKGKSSIRSKQKIYEYVNKHGYETIEVMEGTNLQRSFEEYLVERQIPFYQEREEREPNNTYIYYVAKSDYKEIYQKFQTLVENKGNMREQVRDALDAPELNDFRYRTYRAVKWFVGLVVAIVLFYLLLDFLNK